MAGFGAPSANLDLVKKLASANSKFGLELYQKVASEKKDSNLFLSPFSISAALAMTSLGARGNTASQMSEVLKWTGLKDSVHLGFEDYLSLLKRSQSNYVLTSANRLFVNSNNRILDAYLETSDKHYGAKAVLADFAGNADGEAKKINEWVKLETKSKIKTLISGSIDPSTAMIIVNAIYFKGNWTQPFDPSNTDKGVFKVKPGESFVVDMMKMKKKFNVGPSDNLKCTVLELPYVDKDLSMFILLPDDDGGLEYLEQKLTHVSLTQAMSCLRNVTVNITLPKFVLECSFSLNDVLKSLGMNDAFDETTADLSGIGGSRPLYISQIVHKAFLEVNEEGSEAAAFSAVILAKRRRDSVTPFVADHPFIVVIKDNRCDMVLFIGRVVRPCTL